MRRCIVIEPIAVSGERGQHYRVLCDGAVLIASTWNPEYEAARSLKEAGFSGAVELWRYGKPHADAIIHIEKAADRTVEESSGRDIRLVSWKAWDKAEVA